MGGVGKIPIGYRITGGLSWIGSRGYVMLYCRYLMHKDLAQGPIGKKSDSRADERTEISALGPADDRQVMRCTRKKTSPGRLKRDLTGGQLGGQKGSWADNHTSLRAVLGILKTLL